MSSVPNICVEKFARRKRLDEKEARLIFDPRHPIKLARIETALNHTQTGLRRKD
jgi:hypothetical protein